VDVLHQKKVEQGKKIKKKNTKGKENADESRN